MHVHEGDEPPASCPVCGALASEFFRLEEEDGDKASPPQDE